MPVILKTSACLRYLVGVSAPLRSLAPPAGLPASGLGAHPDFLKSRLTGVADRSSLSKSPAHRNVSLALPRDRRSPAVPSQPSSRVDDSSLRAAPVAVESFLLHARQFLHTPMDLPEAVPAVSIGTRSRPRGTALTTAPPPYSLSPPVAVTASSHRLRYVLIASQQVASASNSGSCFQVFPLVCERGVDLFS